MGPAEKQLNLPRNYSIYILQRPFYGYATCFIQFALLWLSNGFLEYTLRHTSCSRSIRKTPLLTLIIFWSRISVRIQLNRNTDVIALSSVINTMIMTHKSLVSPSFFWKRLSEIAIEKLCHVTSKWIKQLAHTSQSFSSLLNLQFFWPSASQRNT